MRIEELIGENIRLARESAGMTQEELGAALRPYLGRAWPRRTVWLAEQAGQDFSPAELVAFAAVLNRPVGWFFVPRRGRPSVTLPGGRDMRSEDLTPLVATAHAPEAENGPLEEVLAAARATRARLEDAERSLASVDAAAERVTTERATLRSTAEELEQERERARDLEQRLARIKETL